MFKNILLATDFSIQADTAREAALSLAWDTTMKLTVLHAYDLKARLLDEGVLVHSDLVESNARRRFRDESEAHMKEYCQPISSRGLPYDTMIREGKAGETIIRTAQEVGADLIIIGSHSRRGFIDVSLGGVARFVGESAHCPVLIVTNFQKKPEVQQPTTPSEEPAKPEAPPAESPVEQQNKGAEKVVIGELTPEEKKEEKEIIRESVETAPPMPPLEIHESPAEEKKE